MGEHGSLILLWPTYDIYSPSSVWPPGACLLLLRNDPSETAATWDGDLRLCWRSYRKITNSSKCRDNFPEQKVSLLPGKPGGRSTSCSSALIAGCKARDSEMLSHGCQDLSPSEAGGKDPNKRTTELRRLEGLSSETSLGSLPVF